MYEIICKILDIKEVLLTSAENNLDDAESALFTFPPHFIEVVSAY
jgi:hypothetical protein